ncbi:hypothetical protein B0X71_04405 [Planococcus lenghuensis]|uniref:Adenine/guanine phosphoribosyltransferase n=1 Tax=Planococcus lenghuensis TaxID=2213202 RepID=A0A1Q2L3K2_9BACL|nr:hypothetical protein B0X71_04405 [Planococcus lenghuensis]
MTIKVTENPYGISPDSLFGMGMRINKKRQFLFVSRLLGKHLAVDPALSLGTGTVLASMLLESEGQESHPETNRIAAMINRQQPDRALVKKSLAYKAQLPTRTVFIGFAETATGLGHAVFQHFNEAVYLHTTREEMVNAEPSFRFEEEHSHATSHRVYAPEHVLQEAETIVLIDDEITSGRTAANLIISLNEAYPGKRYKVLSILDWRSDEHRQEFTEAMAIRHVSAEVLSMLAGEFVLHSEDTAEEPALDYLSGSGEFSAVTGELPAEMHAPFKSAFATYSLFTGRFGLTSKQHDRMDNWIRQLGDRIRMEPNDANILIIGIGENIYIPQRLALELGSNTRVQTTTRSPIFPSDKIGYPIKSKTKFLLPDSSGTEQYLYNLNAIKADRIIVVAESVREQESWQPLLAHLGELAPVTWLALTSEEKQVNSNET